MILELNCTGFIATAYKKLISTSALYTNPIVFLIY